MPYATGAHESPYDLRTFTYAPSGVPLSGGLRYSPEDIEDQHHVGICTAISVTENAHKALGIDFADDFHYLLQKKYIDKNWDEGSSPLSSLKVAKNYGFLPAEHWTFTTAKDRGLSYTKYIAKLKKVSDADIERLIKLAEPYKITAYSKVPIQHDLLASAIIESKAGLIARYVVGEEWWIDPIEPLRRANQPISGHAVTLSNYNSNSFRIANSWGSDWADKGTAYHLMDNMPTEAWLIHYSTPPGEVQKQLDARNGTLAKIVNLLQQVVSLYQQLLD